MKNCRTGRGAILVGIAVLLIAAGANAADKLQIDGSTTVGPIADAFAEAFKSLHPTCSITVSKTGSGDGVASLIDSRCSIAMASRFMKEAEFKNAVNNGVLPVAHVVAMDGVCVVLHPSNPVQALTTDQVRDIYAGKITNWNQVGGVNRPIVIISRDTSSGTYESFNELVMRKEKMAAGVEYVNSNPQAHARVRSTEGAIGYVGLGFLDRYVKTVKLNGVAPSRSTIARGIFPVSRPLFLFTNGYPTLGSMTHAFVTFHLTEQGQEIIESKGFVPRTEY
ncbi:MAG: phosphate ABC transporter substrate-binding protein [Phycisphaerae bacterium]|nr:phosphate ABC transporter substrate-binding protein [Phycisphaerae bacterium]